MKMGNAVIVEGHTDSTRIIGKKFRSNRELSLFRAFSVIDFLIKNGFPPEKLSAYGYGEFKPVASNETEEGRAKNRRIEIIVLRQEEKTTI
jgi:chemotaxis protein MotB